MMNSQAPLPFEPELLARPVPARPVRAVRTPRAGPRRAVGAPGYLSVRRAAEVLDLQPRSVIYLINQGLLASQRLGRAHFIAIAEVERYRRVRRERARRRHAQVSKTVPIRLVQ